ncbi:MAG: MerC domain-containing protein [Bacteroidota bacterium]
MIKYSIVLDKIGVCTSIICMIHCITIPLLLIFGLDTSLKLIDQEWIELTLITTALCIGMSSFAIGFFRHRQHFIPVLFIAGFLLLVNGESVTNTMISLILSIAGALVIVYAHVQNLRWKRHAVTH